VVEELLSMLSEMMTVNVCVDVLLYCNELVLKCAVNAEEHLQDRCML